MERKRLPVLAIITRAAVAIAVLGAGLGVHLLLASAKKGIDTSTKTMQKRQVRVFEAREVPVRRQWRGWGNVDAIDSADVPAQVKAVVTQIPENVQAGALIKKGDLVVQLERSDFERQVEIAEQTLADFGAQLALIDVERTRLEERLKLEEKDLALARAELERGQRLQANNAATRKDIDDALRAVILSERNESMTREAIDKLGPRGTQLRAQIAGQQASVKLAQTNLDRTRITSPIDGVLQAVDVEIGEETQLGMRVARVVSLAKVEVPFSLPASARADIAVNNVVALATTNQSGYRCDAEVKRISPEDDPATRTATVYVEVEQIAEAAEFQTGGRVLTPGTFVTGTLTSQREQTKWVIPRRSVRNGRMFIVRDGVVKSQPVEADYSLERTFTEFGLPDRQWITLKRTPGDLRPGDTIVINANMALLDGEEVEIEVVGPRKAAHTPAKKEARP